jgi:hypothetical protein
MHAGVASRRPPRSVRSIGVRQMTSRSRAWINRAGFTLGLALAAGTVAAGHVPAGERPLDARLTVTAGATGGLAAAPEGRVLGTHRLAPGAAPARGVVRLSNQTSGAVSVLVRAGAKERWFDDSLRVELRARGGRPLRATLGELSRWRRLGPALPPQRQERIAVRVWIPASAGGHEGRRADVTLEFLRRGART